MPDNDNRPTFTVIAGPNGAGKSTFYDLAKEAGFESGPFINPDVIARELAASKSSPQNLDFAAGREAIRQTRDKLDRGESFTRETTLTSKEILRTMRDAKDAGFNVRMIYVGVNSLAETKDRVEGRAARGGHDIPEEAQDRRYDRSMENAPIAAKIADEAHYYHNGQNGHQLVAEVRQGEITYEREAQPQWTDKALAGLERSRAADLKSEPESPLPPRSRAEWLDRAEKLTEEMTPGPAQAEARELVTQMRDGPDLSQDTGAQPNQDFDRER
ncbi:MAG: AAA family ATPase [Pseudomonadota bacterium]